MTTTLLQWHDATKEDPPDMAYCYIVVLDMPVPVPALWIKSYAESTPWHFVDCTRVKFRDEVLQWAISPFAEQVRQKFKDEALKEEEPI